MTSKCSKCQLPVYAAEQTKSSAARSFHRACFRCSACRLALSQGKDWEREGEVFCKACFGAASSYSTLSRTSSLSSSAARDHRSSTMSSKEEARERRLSESVWFTVSIMDDVNDSTV